MVRIIMTECRSTFGSYYVDFKEKATGVRVGEVDRIAGKYVIFSGPSGWLSEIGTRTKKASAIKFLQSEIRKGYPDGVEFKWNVMCQKVRFV